MTEMPSLGRRRGDVAASVPVGVAGAGIVAAVSVWLLAAGLTMAGLGIGGPGVAAKAVGATTNEIPIAVPVGPIAKVLVPIEVPPVEPSFVMAASPPVRVVVPSIGIDTPLMDLGLMPDGTLQVPPDGTLAGWYTGAPTPGERGPAIIAGHVDWHGPAVFHDLSLMVPGDTIEVTRADGSIAVFAVTELGQYPKAAFPTEAVYGFVETAALRLITCGGVFNRATGHYDDNIVVYAVLVEPS